MNKDRKRIIDAITYLKSTRCTKQFYVSYNKSLSHLFLKSIAWDNLDLLPLIFLMYPKKTLKHFSDSSFKIVFTEAYCDFAFSELTLDISLNHNFYKNYVYSNSDYNAILNAFYFIVKLESSSYKENSERAERIRISLNSVIDKTKKLLKYNISYDEIYESFMYKKSTKKTIVLV